MPVSSNSTFPTVKGNDNNSEMKNLEDRSLKSDLYQSLFPIYYVSKLCGLFPVQMESRGRGIYSGTLQKTTVAYGFLVAVALISFQAWGFWRDFRHGWQNSTRLSTQTSLTITCSDLIAVVSITVSAVFSSPFRWKYLQRIMNILAEVDEKVGNLTVKRLQRITIFLISCPLLYLIIVSILDYKAWKWAFDKRKYQLQTGKGPINYLPLYLMNFVITVFQVQYSLFTFHVAVRFSRLNQFIEKLLKINESKECSKENSRTVLEAKQQENLAFIVASDLGYIRPSEKKSFECIISESENRSLVDSISSLTTLHGNLCDSTSFLNSAFELPLLIGMLGCILHLTIASYFLYSEIKQDDKIWHFLLIQSLWILFHIMKLLIIVQPCYIAINKAKDTATLVSKLLILNWNPNVRKQLELFSLQLLQRPLNFTAFGLFSLNRSLITSIAGAVTTYIVILVQFQSEDDCTKETRNLKDATDMIFKNISLAKLPSTNK